jgi:hypothetical protein
MSNITVHRTNRGKKFHASAYCHYLHRSAVARRTDHAVSLIAALEDGLTACSHCAKGVATPAVKVAEKPAPVYCEGSGKSFKHPGRFQDKCPVCSKMLRAGGSVPKHKGK